METCGAKGLVADSYILPEVGEGAEWGSHSSMSASVSVFSRIKSLELLGRNDKRSG